MKNKVRQKLPKWFDGEVYETGDEVRNPFSGDTCLLTAEELSMYDLIKGAEMVLQMSVAMDTKKIKKNRNAIPQINTNSNESLPR